MLIYQAIMLFRQLFALRSYTYLTERQFPLNYIIYYHIILSYTRQRQIRGMAWNSLWDLLSDSIISPFSQQNCNQL